jgi:hypothetical protein
MRIKHKSVSVMVFLVILLNIFKLYSQVQAVTQNKESQRKQPFGMPSNA